MPRAVIEVTFLGILVIALAFIDIGGPQTNLGFLGAYVYAAFRIMPGMNRIINTYLKR